MEKLHFPFVLWAVKQELSSKRLLSELCLKEYTAHVKVGNRVTALQM